MATSLVNTGVQFPDATIQTTAAASPIPAGTVMLFAQTNAPTGWTKNTSTGNNTALRLVTGTASTGGSVAFTTAFASQTPSGTVSVSGSAGNTTLTTPQIPSHSHQQRDSNNNLVFGPGYTSPNRVRLDSNATNSNTAINTANTGGDGSHNHPLTISSSTFSGSAINLAVSYVDVIRATKD
jgi:hypothetical protein